MTCLFYVLRYILEISNTLNKRPLSVFCQLRFILTDQISRSSRDFPKCKVPSEYVYLHLNISFEKKIDWFTSTRGVYGCLRTCYALKLFNSRQAFMLCLKDQAVSSWFTFARGVYSLITKNEALYKHLLKNKKLRHNKEVSIRQKYINTSCRSESRKIVWSFRQFIDACLDLNIITA